MRSARVASQALGLVFATVVLASAQSPPDAPDPLELLKNVALTYRAMTTYSAKSTSVVEMNGPNMQQKIEMQMTITADSSGKMRMDSTGMTGMLVVVDGGSMWMYMSSLNKYSKLPMYNAAASAKLGGGMQMLGQGTNSFLGYQSVASNVKEAKVLRSENLQVSGSEVACWVVFAEYEPSGGQASSEQTVGTPAVELARTRTLWVDKAHYLVYQDRSTGKLTMPGATAPTETKQTIKFDSITVDQPVSEDTFTFTPPPGATEMDLSSIIPKMPPAQ